MTNTPENPMYPENTMEKLISLCKRKGFIYQGSEIYGGLAGTWDYGPLGVALKQNIQNLWWKKFVLDREDMYGIDAAILMNQEVWKASGHVGGFSDPLVECMECKSTFRVDHLGQDENIWNRFKDNIFNLIKQRINDETKIEKVTRSWEDYLSLKEYFGTNGKTTASETAKEELTKVYLEYKEDLKDAKKYHQENEFLFNEYIGKLSKRVGLFTQYFLNNEVNCPSCKKRNWNAPQQFNMMLKTSVGANEDSSSISYLRPETAQGIFVNFKNVVDSFHPKLPFGIAQIGKAFRNEIAPRDFIFRVRELEQMEIEYFVKPEQWEERFEYLYKEQQDFLNELGLRKERLHKIIVPAADRAHYSKHSIDTEFDFPFGQKELLGLAYRTDFDLNAHKDASKVDISYFDEAETDPEKKRFVPHCIEPTFGVGRLLLAVLADAYREDNLGDEPRAYLQLSPRVAPILVAVSPLLKNKEQLVTKAREVYMTLRKQYPGRVMFDDNGNIGKRYRRQDEIGTPFCVVIDFDTIEQDTGVTIRYRDTGEQKRVTVAELIETINSHLE